MTRSKKPDKTRKKRGVVRRRDARPQSLHPDFEHLARGEKRGPRPERKPGRPRLRDPRPVAQVPGVANRDARTVARARIDAMVRLRNDETTLGLELGEAILMGLWRGQSLTNFEALVLDVLELDVERATQLANDACQALNVPCQTLPDDAVACWMRIEAALLEDDPDARVRLTGLKNGDPQLAVPLSSERAPDLLARLNRATGLLRRDRQS